MLGERKLQLLVHLLQAPRVPKRGRQHLYEQKSVFSSWSLPNGIHSAHISHCISIDVVGLDYFMADRPDDDGEEYVTDKGNDPHVLLGRLLVVGYRA